MTLRLLLVGTALAFCAASLPVSAAPDVVVRYIPLDQDPGSLSLKLSGDGRYATYLWRKNGGNIALHDLESNTISLANVTPSGEVSSKPACLNPDINADGRYVVFACTPLSMGTPAVAAGYSLYVYDRVNNKTELVSVTTSNIISSNYPPTISGDGRYIAYRSSIANETPIFIYDRWNKSTRTTNAKFFTPSLGLSLLSLSSDGKILSYTGKGAAGAQISGAQIYDVETGLTELVNVNVAGVVSSLATTRSMVSSDGNIVAFFSGDNLTPTSIRPGGIYVRDRRTGISELISSGVSLVSLHEFVMSGNGRYIAYTGTLLNVQQLFLYDRLTKVTKTVPSAFVEGRTALQPALSDNGRYLVFYSYVRTTNAPLIGIADFGVEAGLSLSTTALSVKEGGDAATYSLSLVQAPTDDVVVTLHHDKQLSLARTQLTFTSANWNTPQIVSVSAIADGVAEGEHVSTITHSIASKDVNYSVVVPANVTVKISDGVKPTISVPSPTWNRSDMPVSGTAALGATVILTATNRTTGWMSGVSTVADAQGKWSYTLTGFTNGVIEIDAQADGAKVSAQPVTVTLATAPPQPTYTDVTGYIRTTAYGLVRNRSTGLYAGDFVLTNSGSITLKGPLHLQFNELTSTATLSNATGNNAGAPYITVTGDLAPDQSVTIPLLFTNPDRVTLHYDAKIFSGTF